MKRITITLMSLLSLALIACKLVGASDGNLFKNPSFEETQQPNQFGHVFKDWGGWIYQQPSRMAIGTVAHTGRHSYELSADQGGKVRLLSPTLNLASGRYRVSWFMRGLSIGPGEWKIPLGLSVNFDGKNFKIMKNGTFGWTPCSYVFEIDHPVDNFMLGIGLFAGGWLWIDDVSLVKVDDSVPLTKEPVIGAEEHPITPPGPLHEHPVHCTECGFQNNPEWHNCYACGHPLPVKSAGDSSEIKVIADFEDGRDGGFKSGKVVKEKVLQGDYAISTSSSLTLRKPQDWSGFDRFRFDVFNPGDTPCPIFVEIQDAQTNSYWTRVNYDTVVPPGRSTVTLPTELYVGEKARPGRALLRDQITKLYIDTKGKQLLFDYFRLDRLDTDAVLFDGLTAFDFGPLGSPVMPGFLQATMASLYEPGRGFGWEGAKLWKAFNGMQPDPLFQDFVVPWSGNFRVDLPNGKYHVIMNIDSPGGYWGEVQSYEKRKVWANGTAVVDETMTMDGFIKKYFRNADREDVPGIDTFNAYVQPMFKLKEFDVEVTDGKLALKFQGEGFAISLSSLVIYPTAKAAQGRKFWDWVTEQRREQFNDYFKQVLPKRTGQAAPRGDYALFSRSVMKPVNAFDGPGQGEGIRPEGLALTLAQGEEMPLSFSVQPSGDLGTLRVDVSSLTYAGKSHAGAHALPPSVIQPGWLDYRISRATMSGSVYTVSPRYWHPGTAPAAPDVTRTFWLLTKIPSGTGAGPYTGTITVTPQNGVVRRIPVTVNVLPFKLDPISDIAVGPFGAGMRMPWLYENPDAQKWQWQMFEKSLDALMEAGATSFSGVPHLKVKAANGKIELDATLADQEMRLIRSKGFTQVLSAYGVSNPTYQMYGNNGGPDVAAAKKAGFADIESFLKALYGAIDAHAVAYNWLPVAWNLCDEPLGASVKGSIANALAHRKASEGLKRTTFMGETSMTGKDPKDPHYDLVKALLMPSLNNHDEDSIKILEDAGNRFSFYNNESRWSYGRYMKMLQVKHKLALRLSWHFNIVAGDPYYALDCREDDYSWYNTNDSQTMVPSVLFLGQILPGLNDYRYLSTLQRLLQEKPSHSAAAQSRKVFDEMMALEPGKDSKSPADATQFERDRSAVVSAISALTH